MKEERIFKASSGYLFLVLGLLLSAAVVFSFINEVFWLGSPADRADIPDLSRINGCQSE